MDTPQKVNTRILEIWLAENGDRKARLRLCAEAGLSIATLNNILQKDHIPKFSIRYRVCKAIGTTEEELFPGVQHRDAS